MCIKYIDSLNPKYFEKFANEHVRKRLKVDKLKRVFLAKNIVIDKIWFQKKYIIWSSPTKSRIHILKPNFIIYYVFFAKNPFISS